MRVLYRVPSAFLTLILLSAPCLLAQRLSESTGVNLFKNNCTKCHGITPVEHAPTEATIKQMPPERIYAAITTGSMKENAAALSDADKRLLAEYMGGRKLDKEDAGDMKNMPNACATHPPVKRHERAILEWLGRSLQYQVPGGKGGRPDGGQGVAAEAQVGVWIPRRDRAVRANRFRRKSLRQQQRGLRLFARRGHRLHPLVVPFGGGGSQRNHHRAAEAGLGQDRGFLRRHSRKRIRARCIDRGADLEGLHRWSSAGPRNRESEAV